MNSFLKWPGGKRWFAERYSKIFPSVYNCYFEPFLGSASVFFHLEPRQAVLSDTNDELINLFKVMRDQPDKLAKLMVDHNTNHSKEYYYQLRSKNVISDLEHAAKLLYLNRTCYNGMYRVNKNGEFNVPVGTKSKCDQDVDYFTEYSRLLKNAQLLCSDFEQVILSASKGDLVFADPPYAVAGRNGIFLNYNNKLFSWGDQERLVSSLCNARDRGAYVVATNSNNAQLVDMYKEHGFYTREISRLCVMAADPAKRGTIEELLITSYKTEE